MVMYDGFPENNREYGDEYGLTFPILSDTTLSLFARWNPSGETPSTTLLDRGVVVHEIDTTWYAAQIEALVYPD